jgi:MFS family permease
MLIKSSVASMSFIFMKDYHLDASDLSLVGSLFYCVYVIMQIPAGVLVDRFGVKKCLSVATLFAAGGTLIYSGSSEFHMFLIARGIMGIGGSFGFVCALKLASEWFPSRFFPLFAGLTQLLGYLGGAFSGHPLAVIVHERNWPSVFMVIALIGFGLTALTVLFVKNRQDRADLDPTERASVKGTLYQLWELLKQRQILVNGLYCACTVGVTFALTDLWGKPGLMTIDQISEGAASAASNSLVFIGIAVCSPLWGALASAVGTNKKLLILGALMGSVSTLMMLYVPMHVVGLYITGFLIGAAQSAHVLNFDVVRSLVDEKHTATAMAFLNIFGIGGAAIVQILTGVCIEAVAAKEPYVASDYKKGLVIIPALFILAFLLSFVMKDKEPIAPTDK